MRKIITIIVMLVLGSVPARSETVTPKTVAPRIGAKVTLRMSAFACYDRKALPDAFEIARQHFTQRRGDGSAAGGSVGILEELLKEPDKVRGTTQAQEYLGIGCLPISRDDGPFEVTAYVSSDCQIQSSSIKRPAWVRCAFLQTPTGEVLIAE
jgi:hypothetical protein